MNMDKSLYGRITINNSRTSLGRANLATLIVRLVEVYRVAKYHGKVSIQIEIDQDPLPDASTFDPVTQAQQRMAHMIAPPDEESPFPGITNARVAEAMSSPAFARWSAICTPDKRIGVSNQDVEFAREQYRAAFPDCFDHFPRYQES